MQFQTDFAQIPEQFASIYGLGSLRGVYLTRAASRWVSAILGVILIGVAGLAALYGFYGFTVQIFKHGPSSLSQSFWLPFLLAAGSFFLGTWAAVNAYQNWNKAVVAYEKGLAYYDNRGLQTWGWPEIERLYIAITKHYHNGIYTGTTHLYTLQKNDGTRLKLDDKFKQIEALGQYLSQQAAPYQYESLLKQLKSGQIVRLGSVSLSQESLTIGKKTFAWDEIEQVGLRQGYLRIKKAGGGWFSGASAPVAAIPNLNALLAIVEQIVQAKTNPGIK